MTTVTGSVTVGGTAIPVSATVTLPGGAQPQLSGTPSQAGDFTPSFVASDSTGQTSGAFELDVTISSLR